MLGGKKTPTWKSIQCHACLKLMVVKYSSKGHITGSLQPGSFSVDAKSKIQTRFNAPGSCYAQIYRQSFDIQVYYIYLPLPKNAQIFTTKKLLQLFGRALVGECNHVDAGMVVLQWPVYLVMFLEDTTMVLKVTGVQKRSNDSVQNYTSSSTVNIQRVRWWVQSLISLYG